MYDGGDVFIGALLGFLFGFLGFMLLDAALGSTPMSHYPGLETQLYGERDDCEERPGVISCEWSEDKVTYVPKGES